MQKRCVIWLLVIIFYYAYAKITHCLSGDQKMKVGERRTMPPCTLYVCDPINGFGFGTCPNPPDFKYCNPKDYKEHPKCCETVCLTRWQSYDNMKIMKETVKRFSWHPDMYEAYIILFEEEPPRNPKNRINKKSK